MNSGVVLPMLEDLNINIKFVPSKVSIGIEDKIIHVEDINYIEEYRDLLIKFYPNSVEK